MLPFSGNWVFHNWVFHKKFYQIWQITDLKVKLNSLSFVDLYKVLLNTIDSKKKLSAKFNFWKFLKTTLYIDQIITRKYRIMCLNNLETGFAVVFASRFYCPCRWWLRDPRDILNRRFQFSHITKCTGKYYLSGCLSRHFCHICQERSS